MIHLAHFLLRCMQLIWSLGFLLLQIIQKHVCMIHMYAHIHIYQNICISPYTHLFLFSRLVMSNSLWSHGLQHARLPCPLLSPRVCSDSRPLSHWWHPTISSSAACFSSCPQPFPASGSFPMSCLISALYSWSLEKALMLGKIEGKRRRGWRRWDVRTASLTQ